MQTLWLPILIPSAVWLGIQTLCWWCLMRKGWGMKWVPGLLTVCAVLFPLFVVFLLLTGIFVRQELIPQDLFLCAFGTGWVLLLSIAGYRIATRIHDRSEP